MKIWLDAQLSPALAPWMSAQFGVSAVAYGSLRAAQRRRTKTRNYPGTRIMIGTENGGRSAEPKVLTC